MLHDTATAPARSLRFDRADLEIQAELVATAVTIQVMKSGACIHRLVIDGAGAPIEHKWLLDLFAREDRVDLAAMTHDAEDYLLGLDVNQG